MICIRADTESDQSHESIISYRTTIYADPSNTDMDDIRGSLSKMKKKFKYRRTGGKRKPVETDANPGGEATDSLPQPEPHPVADESHDQEGGTAGAAGGQDLSKGRPQPEEPEPVSTCGSENDQGGETSDQIHPHLHSDSESRVESWPGPEVERFSPPVSTALPSLHGQEPYST